MIPQRRDFRLALIHERKRQQRRAIHRVAERLSLLHGLGHFLEFADGFVEQAHLAIGDAEIVVGLEIFVLFAQFAQLVCGIPGKLRPARSVFRPSLAVRRGSTGVAFPSDTADEPAAFIGCGAAPTRAAGGGIRVSFAAGELAPRERRRRRFQRRVAEEIFGGGRFGSSIWLVPASSRSTSSGWLRTCAAGSGAVPARRSVASAATGSSNFSSTSCSPLPPARLRSRGATLTSSQRPAGRCVHLGELRPRGRAVPRAPVRETSCVRLSHGTSAASADSTDSDRFDGLGASCAASGSDAARSLAGSGRRLRLHPVPSLPIRPRGRLPRPLPPQAASRRAQADAGGVCARDVRAQCSTLLRLGVRVMRNLEFGGRGGRSCGSRARAICTRRGSTGRGFRRRLRLCRRNAARAERAAIPQTDPRGFLESLANSANRSAFTVSSRSR